MEVLHLKIIASVIALLSVSGEGNLKLPPIGIYIPPGYPMVLLNPYSPNFTPTQGHGEKGVKPNVLNAGGSFHPIALEPIHLEPIHLQPISIGGKQYTAVIPQKELPPMEGTKGSENGKGQQPGKTPPNGNSQGNGNGKPATNNQPSVRPPTNGNSQVTGKGNQKSPGAEEKNKIGSSTGGGNFGAASVGQGTHTVTGGGLAVTGVGQTVSVNKASTGPGNDKRGVSVSASGVNTGPVSSTAVSTDGGPAISNSVAVSMSAYNLKGSPNSPPKQENQTNLKAAPNQTPKQDGQNNSKEERPSATIQQDGQNNSKEERPTATTQQGGQTN